MTPDQRTAIDGETTTESGPAHAGGGGASGPPPSNGDGEQGRVPYRWVAMGVVLLGAFMVVLDTTIVNLALPSLQRDFGTKEGIAWIVTSYLASVGVAQTASGWIADRFGRKSTFVFALAIFTIASALCALSMNLPMLIGARVLQGVGGGLLMPVGMAMIYELFEPEDRGRALGWFGIAVMAAPALGPVLGGGLVSSAGWRWVFLINLPIGIASVPVALRLLRDTGYRERRAFDATGLALAGTGLALLLIGVERGGVDGWSNPAIIGSALTGAVLLGFFVWHVGRTRWPLVDLRILANPVFAIGMCSIALMSIAQYSRLVYIPLELGSLREFSELKIGIVMMPSAVGVAMTMPIGGRMADRVGARLPVTIGLAVLAASFVGMTSFSMTTPLWLVSLVLFVGGLGTGLCAMAPNIVAMNSVPAREVSQASGLSNVSRQTSAAIGTAVMASIFAAVSLPAGEAVSSDQAISPYRTVFAVGVGLLVVGLVVAQFLPGRAKALALQQERRDEYHDANSSHHMAANFH